MQNMKTYKRNQTGANEKCTETCSHKPGSQILA